MLANFFGKSNPANLIIIFILFLAYSTGAFFMGYSAEKSIIWLVSLLIGFLVLFFFFNFILGKNKLTLYNSYGFLFFVFLLGAFPQTIFDRDELLINVVLLIMLRRIYSLRTPKDVAKKMFDSGFWLAILFILNPFMAIFSILMYSAIGLFQKLNFRSFFIPIIGFITPLIGYFTYCFWMDQVDDFTRLFFWYTDFDYRMYGQSKIMIPMIIVGVMTLLSIIFKTPRVIQVSGNYRKFWTLIILNLLVSVLFISITRDRNGAELLCAFFPTAVILTNGIEGFSRSFFQDLILGLFALMPVVLFII